MLPRSMYSSPPVLFTEFELVAGSPTLLLALKNGSMTQNWIVSMLLASKSVVVIRRVIPAQLFSGFEQVALVASGWGCSCTDHVLPDSR